MGRFSTILALLLVCFLAACAGAPQREARLESLTVVSGPIDPPDSALKPAMEKFLTETEAPVFSQYSFRRHDLDNDGRRDALVIFKNPYGYWCGLYGCTMLVMKATDDSFELVSAVQPVREPLQVSELRTNGWKDILIRVSGRWSETKEVALQFDGTSYPNNPDSLPPALELAGTTRLFYD